MLNTQVEYWKNIETGRHNREMEAVALLEAKAGLSQAETAARNADIRQFEADTNRWMANKNYEVALGNLKVAGQNAAANLQNASSNARNAQTNAENAATNAKNADINAGWLENANKKLPFELEGLYWANDLTKHNAKLAQENAKNKQIENEYADDYYYNRNWQQQWGMVESATKSAGNIIGSFGDIKSMTGGNTSTVNHNHIYSGQTVQEHVNSGTSYVVHEYVHDANGGN